MQVASSAYFYAKADESRTHIGFDGQILAHAALKHLTIRQYSLRALSCLSKNLLRQNCKASVGCAFRDIFGFLWCRWAGAHQDKKGENSRKGALTDDMGSTLVSFINFITKSSRFQRLIFVEIIRNVCYCIVSIDGRD